MSTGDELRAAVSARRDLGPDYEDALIESFLDKMGQEVDRRVDERLAAVPKAKDLAKRSRAADGQRLALAIVSLALGTVATIALSVGNVSGWVIPVIWFAIVAVNGIFATERRP
ncbi:hypothetical protein MTP10_40595 [Nonomuraea sp. 3-1Str]|uniref:hypothetical protein n=1 Tax=unclassified Nonomuraea TaxID=2593643 RepID=UPI0028574AC0|nr:hypothetical protein [Nonomuraea sp. 3-1Str]MDR8415017.1 hypothetical protein [Nonomuraea sp. 3-1Str]